MEKKSVICINQGMTRDIGISQTSEGKAQYVFENHNIRITAINDNTLYTVTNEKGTQLEDTLTGVFLGSCVLNDYIIVFSKMYTGFDSGNVGNVTSKDDYIYRIKYNETDNKLQIDVLYNGNLNFKLNNPIDAVGYYESAEVQKVYWVDGVNPNRFINIADTTEGKAPDYSNGTAYQFNFQGRITSLPDVVVTKNYLKTGSFQAGVMQYFATYCNKYGIETCIVWQSDLQYITFPNRGAKYDEVVQCAFDFAINNLDTNYQYIRIYSTYRAGLNGAAEGRLVAEIPITGNEILYSDDGTNYQNFNAQDIHYLGGQNIIAGTIEYKQDTLFLGDIQLPSSSSSIEDLKSYFRDKCLNNKKEYEGIEICESPYITWQYKKISDDTDTISIYNQQINKSQADIAGFKYRELYRFGVQFMDNNGEWTQAIWIGDKYCDYPPVSPLVISDTETKEGVYIATAVLDLRSDFTFTFKIQSKYLAYRLLVAESSIESRRILTQGVINPTMFNYKSRENNQPFSINSWIFRPRQSSIEHKHYYQIPLQSEDNAEIQGVMKYKFPGLLPEGTEEKNNNNSYDAFALVFSPNYLAGCRLWYKLIYYNTDTCSKYTRKFYNLTADGQKGVEDNTTFTGKESALAISRDNQFLNSNPSNDYYTTGVIPWHFKNFTIVADELIKDTSWDGIASKTISSITNSLKNKGMDVLISENMLPTGKQYKEASNLAVVDVTKVLTYVGLAVALAASVVASVFSFGAAAPAVAAVTGTIISLATAAALTTAGSLAVMCAIGAAAAIGAMAEAEKYDPDVKDIQKQLMRKGITCINNGQNKGKADELTNSLLDVMFNEYLSVDKNPFYLGRDLKLGSDANFYIMGGRLTNIEEKEKNKQYKSDSFYVDESIVTLNAPNIEDFPASFIDNYRLDLIGTIPINQVSTDYTLYAEQGLSSQAGVINGLNKNTKFGDPNVNGLLNEYLYQDTEWDKLLGTPKTEEGSEGKLYDEFSVRASVSSYKTFMWNRNTSLSVWMPGLKIIDVYGEYVTSIPAKPVKKIFANYKYSQNTKYEIYKDGKPNVFKIDINTPILYNSDQPIINVMEYKGFKLYQGNIDSTIIPQEDYTLITKEQGECYYTIDDVVGGECKDPIPLRYKSTPHLVLPITPKDESVTVTLPVINNEVGTYILDKYNLQDIDYSSIEVDGYNVDASKDSKIIQCFNCESYMDESSIQLVTPLSYRSMDTEELQITKQTIDLEPVTSNSFISNYTIFRFWYYSLNGEQQNEINKILIDLYEFATGDVVTVVTELDQSTWNTILSYQITKESNYLNGHRTKWRNAINSIFESKKSILFNVSGFVYEYTKINESTAKIKFICGQTTDRDNNITNLGTPIPEDTILKINDFYYDVIEDTYDISLLSDSIKQSNYNGSVNVIQNRLDWEQNSPYLFLGELVKEQFDYNTWYGGNTEYALEQLNWNVCSAYTSIYAPVEKTWGDTFYQRWECLKTYPFSEQEVNSNVEILSFMLESHMNLDGRSDVNRGTYNLVNNRPSNTNIFNTSYNQQDNFFSYKTLDQKYSKSKFENQVIWSLSKSNLSDIDNWTNISAVNCLQLDGKLGRLNKIINMNDVLLAFQDTGISTIDYNLKSALSTYEGLPLQMGNTGKVTGYTKVTSDIGCHNKWAMCLTDSGLYFIDSYKKALYVLSANYVPQEISKTGNFSTWFKENVNNKIWNYQNMDAFRLNYDSSTKDLYISNNTTCLLYNSELKVFTSFMDYIDTPLLLNNKGKSIAFNQKIYEQQGMVTHISPKIKIYSLFNGPYNKIYDEFKNYSIEYRINPSPYTDNLFTNYQYTADWVNPQYKVDDKSNAFNDIDRFKSFDIVEAWNEYQYGKLKVNTKSVFPNPIKTKFRIWRGDIPRDGDDIGKINFKGDRMRNPWIHLKFTKNTEQEDTTKMLFHNLNIVYYGEK